MNQILNFILLGVIGPQELIIILIVPLLVLIPMILYLLTLQNTLNAVSAENRKMPPGNVWLMLIPLFNIVWQFIIVDRMADSLKAEFAKRNIVTNEERPGYSIGLTCCILSCCSIIPILGILASIGGLICFIMYWVKINDYKTKLQQN
jgi:hypothetical protein